MNTKVLMFTEPFHHLTDASDKPLLLLLRISVIISQICDTSVSLESRCVLLYICMCYNTVFLYVAWADQRHRQCCIRHTEQILNGAVLYDGRQGEGG